MRLMYVRARALQTADPGAHLKGDPGDVPGLVVRDAELPLQGEREVSARAQRVELRLPLARGGHGLHLEGRLPAQSLQRPQLRLAGVPVDLVCGRVCGRLRWGCGGDRSGYARGEKAPRLRLFRRKERP